MNRSITVLSAISDCNCLEIIESLPVPIVTSLTPRREIGKCATEFIVKARFIEFTPLIEFGV